MVAITGVRFRRAGKIYYFDPKDLTLSAGQHVIVETNRGVEYGTVAVARIEVPESEISLPLKSVVRIATGQDDQTEADNREKEKNAFRIGVEKIKEHNLEMKLIATEYTFDGSKIMFYFTADGRIDFRELVKDLASVFRTRIELRQVGVRDEAKLLGGIGICGRELCCHAHMPEFIPVSIKMAKEQNLSLNPTKISGACGRLMCCLKYEQDTYEYLNTLMPHPGETVKTADGKRGEVSSVNVLRQTVKVIVEADNEREIREYPLSELRYKPRKRRVEMDQEEIKELKELEDSDSSKIHD